MPGCGSLYENHTPACMIFIQPFSVPLSPIKEIKEKPNESDMANYGTIVVVDDNPAILTAVKICLAGEFDRVLTLASPDTLLTVLAQEVVDGILLDMNFTQGGNSGQDGLLWLRAIHKKHPAIPVVLVTAYADIKLAVRGLKMGAADFVAKPWDNQELIRVLKDAIDAGRKVVPLEQVEAEHVSKVVERCHGNISRAAELLGITRQTLYAKIKKR